MICKPFDTYLPQIIWTFCKAFPSLSATLGHISNIYEMPTQPWKYCQTYFLESQVKPRTTPYQGTEKQCINYTTCLTSITLLWVKYVFIKVNAMFANKCRKRSFPCRVSPGLNWKGIRLWKGGQLYSRHRLWYRMAYRTLHWGLHLRLTNTDNLWVTVDSVITNPTDTICVLSFHLIKSPSPAIMSVLSVRVTWYAEWAEYYWKKSLISLYYRRTSSCLSSATSCLRSCILRVNADLVVIHLRFKVSWLMTEILYTILQKQPKIMNLLISKSANDE